MKFRPYFPHLLLNVADIWCKKSVCNALKLYVVLKVKDVLVKCIYYVTD